MTCSGVAAGVQTDFVLMTENDLDWVAELEAALHPFPWTRGNFNDALTAGYGCWLMQLDGRTVGHAVLMLVMDEAHLLTISLCNELQGKGLGGVMLRFLAEYAKGHGARQMFLEVRPSNTRALSVYRSLGFEEIGRRKRYYPALDGGREDAIVMRWTLG